MRYLRDMEIPTGDIGKRRIRLSGEQRRTLIREYTAKHLRDVGRLPTQREVLRATGGKAAIVSETLRGIRESGLSDVDLSVNPSGSQRPDLENSSGTRRLKGEQRLKMVARFVEQYTHDHGRLPTQRQVLAAAGGSARMVQQALLKYRDRALTCPLTDDAAASAQAGDVAVRSWHGQRMSRDQREQLLRRYVDDHVQREGRLPTQRNVLDNVGGGARIVQGVLAEYRTARQSAEVEESSEDI